MSKFKNVSLDAKTIENADAISAEIMKRTKSSIGIVPNMYGLMANNTALLDGYTSAYNSFRNNSGFTPPEQEVVFLSVAYENNCTYCMTAHSFVGDKMTNVPVEVTNAIRNNSNIPDEKLKALSLFTRAMTVKRGNPSQEDIDAFFSAGYNSDNILGVIAGIGVKTMSNYFNHVADTPVDQAFLDRKWSKA
jgi:alkylhydroperoxidase family enzyme